MYVKFKDFGLDLSNIQIQILQFLKFKSSYGYEIIQKFQELGLKINTAILYPALKNLEEQGLIASFKSEQARGAKQRKNYFLTEKGFIFIQNLFTISFVPDLYLEAFQPEINLIKDMIKKLDKILVINAINFLDAKELFGTKFIYSEIPKKIKFIRYFNLQSIENIDPQDLIFVNFPFFIHYDITETIWEYTTNLFTKIKTMIKEDGIIIVLDVYWSRNAITDIFSFLITGEAKKMGFTIADMEEFMLKKLGFSKFNIMKQEKGVVLFIVKL
ncbi:MAG: PadR family transcriptional regulator [Candidatus Helarchaeota archaeon]